MDNACANVKPESTFVHALRVYATIADRNDRAKIIDILGSLLTLEAGQSEKPTEKKPESKQQGATQGPILLKQIDLPPTTAVPTSPVATTTSAGSSPQAGVAIEGAATAGLVPATTQTQVPSSPAATASIYDPENKEHKDRLQPIFKSLGMDLRKKDHVELARKISTQLKGADLSRLEETTKAIHKKLTEEATTPSEDMEPVF
jgi:hypothetical protein